MTDLRWAILASAVLLLALAGCNLNEQPAAQAEDDETQADAPESPTESVEQDADASKQNAPDASVAPVDGGAPYVVVHKAKRELILYRPGQPPRTMRIALGPNAEGDKQRVGDGRTPVGTFYVCQKNLKSKYYLFVGISYPSEEHTSAGLADGRITQEQHDAIVQALADRKTPPWYTRLGGEIGFHGGGASWDWTRGCIALENADMRELYAAIRVGMTVTIEP